MGQIPPIQQPFPNYSPPKKSNTGLIVALVLVAGACVGIPIMAAILFPVFSQAREAAKKATCLSNAKQQALAVLMYSTDNNGALPPPTKWMGASLAYSKKPPYYHCTGLPGAASRSTIGSSRGSGIDLTYSGQFGYAYNSNLKGHTDANADGQCVMTFESDNLAWNANDAFTSFPLSPPRHVNSGIVSYVDGHARTCNAARAATVKKTP